MKLKFAKDNRVKITYYYHGRVWINWPTKLKIDYHRSIPLESVCLVWKARDLVNIDFHDNRWVFADGLPDSGYRAPPR